MSSTFPEFTVAKTYIETLLDIPWLESTSTSDLTISKVRETLELEHYGLENKSKALPTILCFSGPPGVGKTSLGRSIANALGRKFERISLGGVHDESEIRGHRRTYVGAIPGVLVQALRRCNCNNPVILLDEIDKIGTGRQSGDPSAALLEVLDPDQNATFVDHYLAVPLDLSQVIFIATANRLDVLSSPLRDRMEIIELSGPPIFEYETSSIIRIPGRSTGLAWTPTGGEILFIESTYIYPSIGKLTITGNMGEVMQEYSSCNEIDDESFSLEKLLKSDIHIHVPAGAIPKDGPSAGCAITVSMISAFLGVPIDNRLAMTGEITLLGDVLPVGGIKEKVLAAKQAGIRTVILPNRNKKDFDKINNEKEIIGTVITKPYDTISITNSNQVLKSSL
eukprot:gene19306-25167_t